ncbi:MAG: hypothetical protein MUD14_12445 [Hydrococcus sp. Prado102]|jgi:hypothetical protein|nr:hypothetical protein [Hydrococcus sp. Prado102]
MTLSNVARFVTQVQEPWSSRQDWCEEFDTYSDFQANTWVKLFKPLDLFCYDEALLLCQQSESEWVAWIPDYGEAILHVSQFCAI